MKTLNNVPRQIRKTTKKTNRYLWPKKKNAETYSPSNAVALDLEGEVYTLPKIKLRGLTDVE